MEHRYLILFVISLLVYSEIGFCQVGIGTVTPSPSSALDISATADGGISYKGMLLPRVPTIANRNTITPNTTTDRGLLIFYGASNCLQIWNGTAWENIHCLNEITFGGFAQNFDLNTTWGYTSDVAFFDNGIDGFFGITDASNSIFSNLTTLTNNFLGIRDLDDEGNGTTGLATITFNSIDVSSALGGTSVAFDWEYFRLDTGDNAYYQFVIDGIPQTQVQFINPTTGDQSDDGSVVVLIPGGTTTVQLILQFEQNGQDDVFGFDNFRIFEN
ncbi:MAG: hypothetical protein CMC13_07500 [Flavobacteriaceae bacterium]|nr:hypothetical protein [Flavobacteriaceae bacterium]|tara:strand:- start:105805 stop:106620 length:816 start_codon:yes stop_codon:yes gene_type:complete